MDLQETNTLQRGAIRLGTVPSVFEYRLPPVLGTFSRRFPNVDVVITRAGTETLLEMMSGHKLDLAVLMPPISQAGLRTISLGS